MSRASEIACRAALAVASALALSAAPAAAAPPAPAAPPPSASAAPPAPAAPPPSAPAAPPAATVRSALPALPAVGVPPPDEVAAPPTVTAAPGPVSVEAQPSVAPPALPPPAPPAPARAEAKAPAEPKHGGEPAHWYERIKIRGYSQLRYNRLLVSNDDYVNPQGDRTIGKANGFSLRRARFIVFGDVHKNVSVYLQTDAANSVENLTHVVAMRDWYADLFLDDRKEARFRVGQSKVPYGFENMQSSQNRLPIDRSDPINTGAPNERDIGAFFYWETAAVRARFKRLVDSGLKGSGDYGIIGLGVYNGQGTNLREKNDNLHVVARATYPFDLGSQIVEVGVGGYTGKYVVTKSEDVGGADEFRDARGHVAITVYPQPIGFQAEYNVGVGPELDAARGVVRQGRLHGGYAMVMAHIGPAFPYVRAQTYDGGKKHETDAVNYKVREVEAGVEWHFNPAVELVAAYVQGRRTAPKAPYDVESGRLLRLQLQFNY
ncbi:MAG TPA: porin [Polyangiaceae bacterium]|nr:porin [Polyangiaceae bacterium]